MEPKVLIENVSLRKSLRDDQFQRVATLYDHGEEYRVYAPPGAIGHASEWVDHFVVRSPSKGQLSFGAEVNVSDDIASTILTRVVDELKRVALESEIWNWGNDDSARFYSALICLHGHVIHADGRDAHLAKREEHCETCGNRCVRACSHCKAPIRGNPTMSSLEYKPPQFCYNCGRAYPWMDDRLQTARDLLWHDDNLTLDDREKLWDLLQYVMSDPKSDLVPAKRKLIDIDLKKAASLTRELTTDLIAKYFAEMSKG